MIGTREGHREAWCQLHWRTINTDGLWHHVHHQSSFNLFSAFVLRVLLDISTTPLDNDPLNWNSLSKQEKDVPDLICGLRDYSRSILSPAGIPSQGLPWPRSDTVTTQAQHVLSGTHVVPVWDCKVTPLKIDPRSIYHYWKVTPGHFTTVENWPPSWKYDPVYIRRNFRLSTNNISLKHLLWCNTCKWWILFQMYLKCFQTRTMKVKGGGSYCITAVEKWPGFIMMTLSADDSRSKICNKYITIYNMEQS